MPKPMNRNTSIKYLFPDFCDYSRNEIIIKLYEKYPNIVREDTSIYSFFGVFYNCIWNGGSVMNSFMNDKTPKEEMIKVRNFYNKKHKIPITFTFTNQLIDEKFLNDEYCNTMLEVFHDEQNEILVVSPILEKYIRENYPKYKINRSIIANEDGNFPIDDYNITVLPKFKNKDFEYLKSIPLEKRKKIEILVDEICINDCPYHYQHYKEYAYIQIYNHPEKDYKDYGNCRYNKPDGYRHIYDRYKNNKYRMLYEDIKENYVPLGLELMKLSGRGNYLFITIEKDIPYLIKPEFQEDIRIYIYERWLMDKEKEIKEQLSKYEEECTNMIKSKEFDYIGGIKLDV